ncbi:hypothetical protein WL77_12800 [Burkholderia ubonensis]|uniref:hypothetical protein n=1 Tax=Burkholderia ubonensis TaxID=101571 RepID=UPI0007542B2E|nr:hypothetical protein [Burkholderia ubonensis]KWE69769.1 hypothetical protein WL77_12800 [Burkholderia ubonensis]KWE79057.1 hypothetical protein WL79_04660 [Burkholderia ubonensis]
MDNTLKLRVMVDMVDNMTKPLQMMLTGNKGLADSLNAIRRELDDMAKTQQRVGEFREMRRGLADTALALKAARAHVDALGQALNASGPPSRRMIRDFENAQSSASSLAATFGRQADQLRKLRGQLSDATADTGKLTQRERELDEVIDQREKKTPKRTLSEYGSAMKDAGDKMFDMLPGLLDEAKQAEIAALRIRLAGGSQALANYAREMKVKGQSISDNLDLIADLQKDLGDEEHTKIAAPALSRIKLTNSVLFGEEGAKARNEVILGMMKVIEQRDGFKSPAAFAAELNAAQKMIWSTDGRVSGEKWNDFAKAGGDAAKRLRSDVFYNQMEPVVHKLGGEQAGKGLAALSGSAFLDKLNASAVKRMIELDLIDPKLVAHKKNGAFDKLLPGALRRDDLRQTSPFEWFEQVLKPKFEAKGIIRPDQVKSELARILPDKDARQMLTAVSELTKEIRETAQGSADTPGVDSTYAMALQTTSGREKVVRAHASNAKLIPGEKLQPNYNAALDATGTLTEKAVKLMQEHGTATSIFATAFAALAGVLKFGGPVLEHLPTSLGKSVMTRVGTMATGALQGIRQGAGRLATGAFQGIRQGLGRLATAALRNVRPAAARVIPLAARHPVIAAATAGAIIVGGITLWKKGGANKSNGIGELLDGLSPNLKKPGSGTPPWSIDSFVKNRLDALVNLPTMPLGWFPGTSSLKAFIPGRPFGNPANARGILATLGTAAASLISAPAFAANTPAAGALPIGNRAPLTAPAAAASAPHAPITINITPPPGVNAAELARLVRVELERAERAKASRATARLSD